MMKMYTLGHSFVPSSIHAGGLRYHGDSPIVSALAHEGLIEARAYSQNPTFEAGVTFARTEGIVPAPEVTHAIKATIDLALEAREAGEQKTILFNLCGHGHFDFSAYQQYLAGELVNLEHSDEEIEAAVAGIPGWRTRRVTLHGGHCRPFFARLGFYPSVCPRLECSGCPRGGLARRYGTGLRSA